MSIVNLDDHRALIAGLNNKDRRTLISAAKVVITHGDGRCRLLGNTAQRVTLTEWFIQQLREIVDNNVCIRCGGTGRIGDVDALVPCFTCDATGIA